MIALTSFRILEIGRADGYVDTKDFYDYLLNRINVKFIPRLEPEQESFTLTLSKKMTYDQFATKVGEHLNVDPTHIRFTTINPSGKPKAPVKFSQQNTLSTILIPSPYAYGTSTAQKQDALFYEVLEMSLKELEQRKAVKVSWLPEGLTKEEEYQLMLPRAGRVSELLEALQAKANISPDVMKRVRIFEAHNHKWYKDLDPEVTILSIGDYFDVYACAFPLEESERTISVFHFDKELSRLHSIPFRFSLKEVGLPCSVKVRLLTRARASRSVRPRSGYRTL